jgi:5-formyltetrahydrofolate cyclo-ligase
MDDATNGDALLRRKVRDELRKRMRAVRRAAPASACGARSALIVARLEALAPLATATNVALFWPIEEKNEVDLRALDATLRAKGATVAYPSIDRENETMTFRVTRDTATLEERGFGFREPPLDAPEATELDVVIVPSLALDSRGHRLGYGTGFYDRTLPAFPRAVTVGVAFDYGLLIEIPEIETDVAMHWVVTDKRTIEIADATR